MPFQQQRFSRRELQGIASLFLAPYLLALPVASPTTADRINRAIRFIYDNNPQQVSQVNGESGTVVPPVSLGGRDSSTPVSPEIPATPPQVPDQDEITIAPPEVPTGREHSEISMISLHYKIIIHLHDELLPHIHETRGG